MYDIVYNIKEAPEFILGELLKSVGNQNPNILYWKYWIIYVAGMK